VKVFEEGDKHVEHGLGRRWVCSRRLRRRHELIVMVGGPCADETLSRVRARTFSTVSWCLLGTVREHAPAHSRFTQSCVRTQNTVHTNATCDGSPTCHTSRRHGQRWHSRRPWIGCRASILLTMTCTADWYSSGRSELFHVATHLTVITLFLADSHMLMLARGAPRLCHRA